MVTMLDRSPGQGHCVVFLGKTLNSHNASLHASVNGYQQVVRDNLYLRWTSIPSRGVTILLVASAMEVTSVKHWPDKPLDKL